MIGEGVTWVIPVLFCFYFENKCFVTSAVTNKELSFCQNVVCLFFFVYSMTQLTTASFTSSLTPLLRFSIL